MPGFFDGQLSLKQFFTAEAQSNRTMNRVFIRKDGTINMSRAWNKEKI